ncbi:MAG: hypothetical protein WCS30_13045 [Selenomonadaceae bacterium]
MIDYGIVKSTVKPEPKVIDEFSVNTNSRKIYATRIGFGEDREWTY